MKSFHTIIHLFNLNNSLIVYSLSYLINADPTGLTDLEIELIDGFLTYALNTGILIAPFL